MLIIEVMTLAVIFLGTLIAFFGARTDLGKTVTVLCAGSLTLFALVAIDQRMRREGVLAAVSVRPEPTTAAIADIDARLDAKCAADPQHWLCVPGGIPDYRTGQ
jgi:hypothetical protein